MARGPILLLVVLLAAAVAPAATANTLPAADSPYQAKTLWSAKRAIDVDEFLLLGREPWSQEPAGRGVTIGIVDTGIDPSHPDLDDKNVRFKDFTDGGSLRPYDDQGHGTHVAGIAAGDGHFQSNPAGPYVARGARGIAPEADLLVAKAITSDGTGDDTRVAEAIRWLVDPNGDGNLEDGADVINLSLGIGEPKEDVTARRNMGSDTQAAVERAIEQGVVVVVSSGNGGMNTVSDPGDLDPVISVGATTGDGVVPEFSNYGRYLDVAAPGILLSPYPKALDTRDGNRDGYTGMAGTSMAAPVVAGLVALLMEADPGLARKSTVNDMTPTVERVQDVVRSTAVPPEGAGERASYGVVNAHGSLLAVDQGTDALDWRAITVMALLGLLVVRGGMALRGGTGRTESGSRNPEPRTKAEPSGPEGRAEAETRARE